MSRWVERVADRAAWAERSRRLSAWALRRGPELVPGLVVLVFALWLLWPVPRGVMPMSADHTVHLTRIALTAERLTTQLSLSGWEPTWFFGFPLGDLYPQLGDLLILAIRALSLGALDWPSAYALGFTAVFAIQGLVLVRVGRLFGFGPWPGLVAALLMLADPGFTREGGWLYTVYFGVWPQALATSLAWLGLGELIRALGWRPSEGLVPAGADAHAEPASEAEGTRATWLAGLWFGAALLAHPIALPTLVIGGGLVLVTLVPRAPVPWRLGVVRCVAAGLLGLLLAAWWLVPMLQHKAWMASYGWLYAPLEVMLRWLTQDGRWAQRMPEAVGIAALLGIVLASLGAGRVARFVALFALVQWLFASDDAFWRLRLDRLSEGFTHIQYQRFLIGAKPGLYLCAGLAVIAPAAWARRLWLARTSRARPRWQSSVAVAAALALAGVSAGLGAWLVRDSRASLVEHEVGVVQTERLPGKPEFEADYAEFLAWARAQWDARESDYRIAVVAARNHHLFMDAPVWTDTPQYKLGFTPGDNFVHKPEAGRRELLDALGVRWMVSVGRQRPDEVARFGSIGVRPHRPGQERGLAWVQGPGTVEIVHADLRAGEVRVRVHGVARSSRLVFAIAGYPRWQARVDGEPVEWVEAPVWGDGPDAEILERKAGLLRGGKARGDDGSEPTLIAVDFGPKFYEPTEDELEPLAEAIEVELRYQSRGRIEAVVELLSALAWLALGLALIGQGRAGTRLGRASAGLGRGWAWMTAKLHTLAHPLVVAALVVAALGLGVARWHDSATRAERRLVGWVESGDARVVGGELGPVKTDMLLRPALLLRPRPGHPASVELELDALPWRLTGWVGLDDDQAQQGGRWSRHQLRFEVRPRSSADAQWSTIAVVSVPHEPGRVALELPTGDFSGQPVTLRVVDETTGKRLPRLGLDLDLGPIPSDEGEAP